MGRYIEIKKISETKNIYYYSVFSPDYNQIKKFYIGIIPQKNDICFYLDVLVNTGKELQ